MATANVTAPAAPGDAYTAAQSAQDARAEHGTRVLRVWRGEGGTGRFEEFATDVVEGMVVLDAIHQIQAEQATTSPCAGTARRASAARARRRSTGSRASCA